MANGANIFDKSNNDVICNWKQLKALKCLTKLLHKKDSQIGKLADSKISLNQFS